MNRVKFEHSPLIDFVRVLFTLENDNFYKVNDYKVFLPQLNKKLKERIINHAMTKNDYFLLLDRVTTEYRKHKRTYYKVKGNLSAHWKKVEKRGLYGKIEKLTQQKLPKQITCYLTVWGSRGSEIPPDKIVARVFTPTTYRSTVARSIGKKYYTSNLGFELVELSLYKYQKKYAINQNKYIRIVDLILNKTRCFYAGASLRGDNSVDKLYEKHADNIETLFQKLSTPQG